MMWSMGFNIAEAALGVLLVVAVLPRWALDGYVFVIFFCEIFNFTLSISRLRRVARFRIFSFGRERKTVLPRRKGC